MVREFLRVIFVHTTLKLFHHVGCPTLSPVQNVKPLVQTCSPRYTFQNHILQFRGRCGRSGAGSSIRACTLAPTLQDRTRRGVSESRSVGTSKASASLKSSAEGNRLPSYGCSTESSFTRFHTPSNTTVSDTLPGTKRKTPRY